MTPAEYAPLKFTAGDTLSWAVDLPDYSKDDGWSVTYTLRGAAKHTLPTATSLGTLHTTTVPAATTSSMAAGDYWLFGIATNATTSERKQFYYSPCEVLADPTAGTAVYDGRTHCQKVIDAIEAAIEGRASRVEQSYMVSGGGISKQLNLCSPEELRILRQHYKSERRIEEDAERVAAGKKRRGVIYARFV